MALGKSRKCVSLDLSFHIENCKTLEEAWDRLIQLYGQVDDIRGYTLDNDLINLDPNNFDTIQDYITKANELEHNSRIVALRTRMHSWPSICWASFLQNMQRLFVVYKSISRLWVVLTLQHHLIH